MQKLYFIIPLFLILSAFPSCKDEGGDGETDEDVNTMKLSGKWVLAEGDFVTRDGVDITEQYNNFKILFTSSHNYTVQEDPNNVFYPTGTWKFVQGTYSQIVLNSDTNPITLSYEGDNKLRVTFTVLSNTPIGQRTKGISGEYEFRLTRE